MLPPGSMKRLLLVVCAVCYALLCVSCMWSPETSFFSKFSVRQLVERSRSSTGFTFDMTGGGGGGIGSRMGGVGAGGSHFHSHKGDSVSFRLKPNEPFDEAALFSVMKLDVETTLRDNGAQITESGSSGPANFFFNYVLKNVRGRVELSGTRIGNGYYDVHAALDENRD